MYQKCKNAIVQHYNIVTQIQSREKIKFANLN